MYIRGGSEMWVRSNELAWVGNGRDNDAYVNNRQVLVLKMTKWYIKCILIK